MRKPQPKLNRPWTMDDANWSANHPVTKQPTFFQLLIDGWPAAAMGAILGFVGAELICHVVFGVPW